MIKFGLDPIGPIGPIAWQAQRTYCTYTSCRSRFLVLAMSHKSHSKLAHTCSCLRVIKPHSLLLVFQETPMVLLLFRLISSLTGCHPILDHLQWNRVVVIQEGVWPFHFKLTMVLQSLMI